MGSLVDKIKNAAVGVVIGAASLFGISGNASAEMIMSTSPAQTQWASDGSTQYKIDVRADSRGVPDSRIRSIEWDLVVPSELNGYVNFVSSNLPDGNVNPSRAQSGDFFSGYTMNSSYNFVAKNGDLASNARSVKSATGPLNKEGVVGSYTFTLAPNAPKGSYSFDLDNVWIYDPSSNSVAYRDQMSGDLQVNNTSFEVTPEPATAALLALGGTALLFRTRRRNSGKWVDPKTLEGKTGSK